MNYATIRNQMKTGDVIAFSGKGNVSEIIKRFTDSAFSHVGSVYRNGRGVFLVESTTLSSVPDHIHNKRLKGFQMVLLSDRLRTYDGETWWAPIQEEKRQTITPEVEAGAIEIMYEWLRKKIPYDTVQAMGAGVDWWDRWFENDEDFSALFCSEWVSAHHEHLGLYKGNTSERTPMDVMEESYLKEPVPIEFKLEVDNDPIHAASIVPPGTPGV